MLYCKNNGFSLKAVISRKLLYVIKKQQVIRQELRAIHHKIMLLEAKNTGIIKQKNAHFKTLTKKILTKIELKNKMRAVISSRISLIESKFDLFQNKINFLMNFILKRRIKRYSLKSKISTRKGAAQILYFLTRRRIKKEKKLTIPRLKKVH